MTTALFPGTFRPFTRGHAAIVQRALRLFDHVVIGIGYNAEKPEAADIDARVADIARLYETVPQVTVRAYHGLTTDCAAEVGADCLLRGVRSVKDFEYERDIAEINRQLSGLETIILISEPQYAAISSSLVRELQHYGKDVTSLLPSHDQL
ncbi:MAG: pantetheine-phosphate adenylyltransferase [Bacteroidales bacterium]|nr:pantetheine-phosphate adenylyltransferase [Candidatus Equimonas enterica]